MSSTLESLLRTDANYTIEQRVERHKKFIIEQIGKASDYHNLSDDETSDIAITIERTVIKTLSIIRNKVEKL